MQDSAKYLIHAQFRASGVVERSDVVGAIFGQTEGLLGEQLDLRDLQESSKVGRIAVEMSTEEGQSHGTVTIASGLDRVETAVLAAGLETIERIGPCRSEFEVSNLEDARAAKRREVVSRATDLLADFEERVLTSHELVEAVRQNVRVEDVTDYEGFPAGPRVANTDAIIVVEGRADVVQLLKYGIKTAIAVEGTDVPDEIADLTQERTVTAFLDGDRGGNLILRELAQVGNVDYVAFAPEDKSVEDLDREELLAGLRKKVPFEEIDDVGSPREALAENPQGADLIASSEESPDSEAASEPADSPAPEAPSEEGESSGTVAPSGASESPDTGVATETAESPHSEQERPGSSTDSLDSAPESDADESTESTGAGPAEHEDKPAETPDSDDEGSPPEPVTLADHVEAVVGGGTGQVRLLDGDFDVLDESGADAAFDAIEGADQGPHTVVVDGNLSQRVLDVAAQRGVPQVVARGEGEFVKRPTGVRVRTAETF